MSDAHPHHRRRGGRVYSNLGFEVLGNQVATWLGYPDWNQANAREITQPLGMAARSAPLESFGADQAAQPDIAIPRLAPRT